MVHLTGRCNLECRHCYMDGSPRRRDRLPLDWVLDAVRTAPVLGIGSLFLTGGEPLLHPNFAELAEAAGAVTGLSTTICTNATLVRQREAERFARLAFQVHVSIDGNQEFHDDFRRLKGAFVDAARGIQALVEAGVPVTIVTTISTNNFEQFPSIVRWVVDTGATRLLVQPLLDLGRASLIADQRLSSEQLNMLIMQTSDIANLPGRPLTANIIGASKRFLLTHPCAAYVCNGGGCHRGVTAEVKKVVVRENGMIFPEATNLDPRYAIGSIDDGRLADSIAAFFAHGYAAFDALCRSTYDEHVPGWPDAIVPWDELIAARSREFPPAEPTVRGADNASGCGVESLAAKLAQLVP